MKVPDKEQIDGLNGSIYFELDASNPETGNQLQLLFGTPDAQVVDETKTNWSLIINKSGNSIIAGSYQDQSTNGDPNGLRPYERDIINFNDRNNKSLESPTDNPSTGSTGSQCRTPAEDRCIYFNNDESTLDHEDIDILAPALRALSETPSLSLSIEGNTDMNASSTYNQGLGTRRATSTSQYFEGEGISKDRISIRSNGETYAAQGSPSADQLASDRNAEIKVIYPQKGH
ncbi:MAG: OmpA family protein [Bacteroidetes bacterium]|nr:OmpA family protein [Bacteroidota bacterium]